jgi:hypothetical protein
MRFQLPFRKRADPALSTPLHPDDPPFEYRRADRHVDIVANDVYAQTKTGKKWHRIHHVGYQFVGHANPQLASYGRGFAFVCGDGVSEFEPSERWEFSPTPIRTDEPAAADLCRACRQSDAKHGKGTTPNKYRWDR